MFAKLFSINASLPDGTLMLKRCISFSLKQQLTLYPGIEGFCLVSYRVNALGSPRRSNRGDTTTVFVVVALNRTGCLLAC